MRIRHLTTRRRLGIALAVLTGGALVAPVLTITASAQGGTGLVEICKNFTAPPIAISTTAQFTFNISGVDTPVVVTAGTCSAPITVPTGSQTVTETSGPWYQVSAITELPGQTYLTNADLPDGIATVNVTPDDNVDTVTFTNEPVTGYLEVCKNAAATSGLTGNYTFDVTGADGFSSTTTVPVGACSNPPMQVPAGQVTVTEAGTNLYVTGIMASLNGGATNELTSSDLTTGTGTVNVMPSADPSNQTDVNYTDNVVSLKVCKIFDTINGDEPGGSTTMFPFTETAAGNPGPNTAPAPFSLQAGSAEAPVCSTPVAYRPGTVVTLNEGIVPGTKVESITAAGAGSIVPDSLSVTAQTVQVVVGTPTTSAGTPTDEAVVYFTNEAANPGTLKICKTAGTPAPIGTLFNFTVTGVPGVTTVPVGSCVIVGGDTTPFLFPFNSTVTVTEAGSADNAASAISVIPTNVTEIVGTTPTLMSETTLAGPPTLGGTGTDSSVTVMTGESTLTETTFTNIDPPVAGSVPVTVSNPGSSNAGTTTAFSTSTGSVIAAAVSAAATSSGVASTHVTKAITTAIHRAAIARDRRALVKALALIRQQVRVLAHKHGDMRRPIIRRLVALIKAVHHLQAVLRTL